MNDFDFLTFIRDIIPQQCAVDAAYGKKAEIMFWRECEGEPLFDQEHFAHEGRLACRKRVECLYMGFPNNCPRVYEHYLDMLEMVALFHRQEVHKDNWQDRIDYLSGNLSKEEIEFAQKAWWVG